MLIKIQMTEMNQFCSFYLPQYFAEKYKDQKFKPHFFDFKSPEQNIYQLTAKIFTLIDELRSVNSSLSATSLIQSYFLYQRMHFSKQCKDLREEEQDNARKNIRKILKKMDDIHRQCFQIYMRIVYLYFDCKQIQNSNNPNKIKKRNYIMEDIVTGYQELRITTMTSDDSFCVPQFMQYSIGIFLDMKPSQKFFQTVQQIITKCQFSQIFAERIQQKMNLIQKNRKRKQQILVKQVLKPKCQNSKQKQQQQSVSEEVNKQNSQSSAKTPVKEQSTSKKQRNTHETSQKKQHIIAKQQNQPNAFESLKKSLTMSKITVNNKKQRTIYSRKTYFVQKKMTDQISSTGSNNNNDDLCLIDFSRSYSSRCLPLNYEEEQDHEYLVQATPKARKKVKLQKTFSIQFDDNGNFVKGF